MAPAWIGRGVEKPASRIPRWIEAPSWKVLKLAVWPRDEDCVMGLWVAEGLPDWDPLAQQRRGGWNYGVTRATPRGVFEVLLYAEDRLGAITREAMGLDRCWESTRLRGCGQAPLVLTVLPWVSAVRSVRLWLLGTAHVRRRVRPVPP